MIPQKFGAQKPICFSLRCLSESPDINVGRRACRGAGRGSMLRVGDSHATSCDANAFTLCSHFAPHPFCWSLSWAMKIKDQPSLRARGPEIVRANDCVRQTRNASSVRLAVRAKHAHCVLYPLQPKSGRPGLMIETGESDEIIFVLPLLMHCCELI